MSKHTLSISEDFYSIQGEGPTSGVPAVFLRLKGCNLSCGGLDTIKTKALDNGATWRCDTIETWMQGTSVSNADILADWHEKGYIEAFQKGAHLVITGGEPLLQEEALVGFLEDLEITLEGLPYIEIETNATLKPGPELADMVMQYNVSPKLVNSGMLESKRVFPGVLKWFAKQENACFKFVVSDKADLVELFQVFVGPFELDPLQVYLMPAAEDQKTLQAISNDVVEMCKETGFRFSSRLQVGIWDQCVGK